MERKIVERKVLQAVRKLQGSTGVPLKYIRRYLRVDTHPEPERQLAAIKRALQAGVDAGIYSDHGGLYKV